jgi:hypothetical protein
VDDCSNKCSRYCCWCNVATPQHVALSTALCNKYFEVEGFILDDRPSTLQPIRYGLTRFLSLFTFTFHLSPLVCPTVHCTLCTVYSVQSYTTIRFSNKARTKALISFHTGGTHNILNLTSSILLLDFCRYRQNLIERIFA